MKTGNKLVIRTKWVNISNYKILLISNRHFKFIIIIAIYDSSYTGLSCLSYLAAINEIRLYLQICFMSRSENRK